MTENTRKQKLTWTDTHVKVYKTLWNKYTLKHPKADFETFLDKETFRRMYNFIESDENIGDGSKKIIYFMIARYLEIRGNNNFKKYLEKAVELRNKIDNQEQDNAQSDKEKEHYRSHEFLLNIVDKYELTDKYKQHMMELALMIGVYQPPLRTTTVTSLKIIFRKQDNDKTHNFILINKSTKKMFYIINDDKVSKTYSYQEEKYKTIEITDKRLKEFIIHSITTFPNRTYLIQTKEGAMTNKIGSDTYNQYLRKMTLSKGIDNNMLRSSYVNWFYNKFKTYNKRDALARQMRHSVQSALIYYFKDLDDETKEITPDETVNIVNDNALMKAKLDKCESKELTEKQMKKKRYDILYSINKKGNVPKASTIDKYNLVFNEETNQFE